MVSAYDLGYIQEQESINLLEKMLSVEADENKYSDQFIIDLVAKIGYVAERI